MAQSRFKGASQAKISEKGTKCSDGKHLLEIKRITYSDSGANGDYYVVEFSVIESGNEKDPVGSERVWTQSMTKKAFPLGKLNAFMFSAAGYDHKNVADAKIIAESIQPQSDDILDATTDESDPLNFVGRRVWADVKNITSNGFPFAAYTFSPGQTDKLDLA
jgi:hypothetical protein